MPDVVLVPGGRDVRASLDGDGTDRCVVACPPHPQYGGTRSDVRLRAVSDALGDRGIACLRFDYGPWDDGRGERTDAVRAVDWATDRYERVGLFGYSFGGAVALLAAPDTDVGAVSALASIARLPAGLEVSPALRDIPAPIQIVYGERDTTADWEPVVEAARALDATVVGIPGDHFFVGQTGKVGDRVGGFMDRRL